METEDGSVLVYSNVENSKKFEIAVFKSERKLFSRRNIKPGTAVAIKVNPSLNIMPVSYLILYIHCQCVYAKSGWKILIYMSCFRSIKTLTTIWKARTLGGVISARRSHKWS